MCGMNTLGRCLVAGLVALGLMGMQAIEVEPNAPYQHSGMIEAVHADQGEVVIGGLRMKLMAGMEVHGLSGASDPLRSGMVIGYRLGAGIQPAEGVMIKEIWVLSQ